MKMQFLLYEKRKRKRKKKKEKKKEKKKRLPSIFRSGFSLIVMPKLVQEHSNAVLRVQEQ